MIKDVIWVTAAAASIAVLTACSPISDSYGYVPMDYELEELETGVTTKAQVAETIGLPAVADKTYGDDWFYVSSQFQKKGFLASEETARQVVVVSFDGEEMLSNVQTYTLRDGRAVVLSRRVTETNLGRLSLIQQILRGIGRIDLDRILGQD